MAHGDNQSIRTCMTLILGVVVAMAPLAAAQTPAEAFDAIFGDAMEAVAKTRDSSDDAELAWRLVRLAEHSDQYPALAALMCERAYELSLNAPEHTKLPIRALEQVAQFAPDQAMDARQRIVDIYTKQYSSARAGLTKRYTGRTLIDAQLALADVQVEAHEWDEAMATLRQATRIAERDVPRREGAVARAMLRIDVLHAAGEAIVIAERKFADAPSAELHAELVHLYLTGLDDPQTAMGYLDESQDMITATYLPLAAKATGELAPATALELGHWYASLAEEESPHVDAAAMLDRARTYYTRALAGEMDQATLTEVQARIDEISAAYSDLTGLQFPANRFHDLLELLSVPDDIIQGRASAGEAGLWLGMGDKSTLHLPVRLTGGYVLRSRVTRLGGGGPMCFILPAGETHIMLVLDDDAVSGLENIDGQPAIRNATGVVRTPLEVGQPVAIDITVRWTDLTTTVIVKIGGPQKIRWSGQATSLSVPDAWAVDQAGSVVLGTDGGMFLLDTLELKPEDEGAFRLR